MENKPPVGRPGQQIHHDAQYWQESEEASASAAQHSLPPHAGLVGDTEYDFPSRLPWPMDAQLSNPAHAHPLSYAMIEPLPGQTVNPANYLHHTAAGTMASSFYSNENLEASEASRVAALAEGNPQISTLAYRSGQALETPAYPPMIEPTLSPSAIFQAYDDLLRRANTSTVQGLLTSAAEHVLAASELLLRNVRSLGLVFDREDTYEQRLKLFRDFNRCWLALAQREIDALGELIDAGRTSITPHLLDDDAIQHLGNMLIRLCDPIAKDGLVDYEMGVEEERILDTLVVCRDLIKKVLDPEGDHTSAGRPESWSSAGSRSSRR